MYKIVLISCCILLGGCAKHYGAASIISHPSGAEIVDVNDGTTLGVTPATVWWQDRNSNRKNIILRFKKDGFYDKTDSFWLSMRHKNIKSAKKNLTLMEVALRKKGN